MAETVQIPSSTWASCVVEFIVGHFFLVLLFASSSLMRRYYPYSTIYSSLVFSDPELKWNVCDCGISIFLSMFNGKTTITMQWIGAKQGLYAGISIFRSFVFFLFELETFYHTKEISQSVFYGSSRFIQQNMSGTSEKERKKKKIRIKTWKERGNNNKGEMRENPVHEKQHPNLFIVHTSKDKRSPFLPHYFLYAVAKNDVTEKKNYNSNNWKTRVNNGWN